MTVSRKAVASVAVLLFLSLAVNLFMAGVFAGRMMRPPRGVENVRYFSLDHIADDLPPDVRRQLRRDMRSRRKILMDRQQAMRGVQNDIARILRADPFDTRAAQNAFAALRQEQLRVQETVQSALIAAASHMPVKNRQRLIERHMPGHHGMAMPRSFRFRFGEQQEENHKP